MTGKALRRADNRRERVSFASTPGKLGYARWWIRWCHCSRSDMSSFAERYPRYDVLGTKVHAVNAGDLVELMEEAVRTRTQLVISHQNLHSAYISRRDERIR